MSIRPMNHWPNGNPRSPGDPWPPQTLNPERLAEIRRIAAQPFEGDSWERSFIDQLLVHIDALAAASESRAPEVSTMAYDGYKGNLTPLSDIAAMAVDLGDPKASTHIKHPAGDAPLREAALMRCECGHDRDAHDSRYATIPCAECECKNFAPRASSDSSPLRAALRKIRDAERWRGHTIGESFPAFAARLQDIARAALGSAEEPK